MVLSEVWLYALISVFIVSFISLIGVLTIGIQIAKVRSFLILLVSLSAGALFGDVFLHLLPELVEGGTFSLTASFYILAGVVIFFFLEKVIHWQHCHGHASDEDHVHAFAYTNLIGDGMHNFFDGIIIAGSYIISLPVGIATTIAVSLHEIPQEIGDFGILVHAGFSTKKALIVNFLSALMAVIGALVVLIFGVGIDGIEFVLVPLTIGGFLYIAGSDLIPELHKHSHSLRKSFYQLIAFIAGILIMASLLGLE
jgi:zinc and cadmium transporter